MQHNDIDTYNTMFNHYLMCSGWPHTDRGTLERY
jgi:hypothetical protein